MSNAINNKDLQVIKENIQHLPLHMQYYLLAKVEDIVEAKKQKKEAAAV